MTDRVSHRKPLASIGYLVTAVGIAAIGVCTSAWQVLLCRAAAWIGRGSRSAPRDVLVLEAAPAASAGKAFGLERAGDAAGAVLGPLLAVFLLNAGITTRHLFYVSLVPGLLAFLSIALLVKERPHVPTREARTMRASLAATGRPFRRYLLCILLFGCGDFSRTLLILYATQHLAGTVFSWSAVSLAIGLYVLHNAVSSAAALPLGALADHVGRRAVVLGGYVLAAAVTVGFALLAPTPLMLAALFVGSGLYIACEEVGEKAYASELLRAGTRGTGMGVLAATNGLGDFVSSALVGTLWALYPAQPAIGLFAAAALQLAGAVLLSASGRAAVPSAP
jgi:MFS family permease